MRHQSRGAALIRALLVIGAIAVVGVVYWHSQGEQPGRPPAPKPPETYRLVHAIGNDETVIATGLSKRECETRKADRIALAEALGIHSERLGIGSITCLPDSLFNS